MRNQTLFASLAMAMLGACVGGIDMPTTGGSGSNPDQTAREQFDSSVAPLLSKCAGCHVGPETTGTNMFLGQAQSKDSFYNGITSDRAINGGFTPAAATLLSKGSHEGPAWSGTEAQTISNWLDAELSERGVQQPTNPTDPTNPNPDPVTPNLTARGAEMQWAACLSVSATEFTATKAYAVADMNSENGRCYSCHEPGGAGGAYWGKNNAYLDMLGKWQTELFITGTFQAQAVSGTPVKYKMTTAQSKICAKGTEKDNNAGTHPSFDCNQQVDGVNAMTALATFTTQVQAKADAGTCPTAAFAPDTAP